MLIFNTTYKVSNAVGEKWLKWMVEHHIPFMTASGNFNKPQVAKVVGSEDESGTSYSVQFQIIDMNTLMQWHTNNASVFQNNCSSEFGKEVDFFSTVLEIID